MARWSASMWKSTSALREPEVVSRHEVELDLVRAGRDAGGHRLAQLVIRGGVVLERVRPTQPKTRLRHGALGLHRRHSREIGVGGGRQLLGAFIDDAVVEDA